MTTGHHELQKSTQPPLSDQGRLPLWIQAQVGDDGQPGERMVSAAKNTTKQPYLTGNRPSFSFWDAVRSWRDR